MPDDHDVLSFVLEKSHERVIVYESNLKSIYENARARKFLSSFDLPEEIPTLARRIFDAIARREELSARFPGQISFPKEIGGRRWVFRVVFREVPTPLVCVLFSDETVSDRFDLNAVRRQHSLTRREVDVLRHLLDGLGNQGISEELGIAEQTVKEYVSGIYGKVGVNDRFSLLRHFMSVPQRSGHQE